MRAGEVAPSVERIGLLLKALDTLRGLLDAAREGGDPRASAQRVAKARPTAVNLSWGVGRALEKLDEGAAADGGTAADEGTAADGRGTAGSAAHRGPAAATAPSKAAARRHRPHRTSIILHMLPYPSPRRS